MQMHPTRLIAGLFGAALLVTTTIPATAAPAKAKPKTIKSAKVTCPKCKMTLSTKPSGHARTPVKVNGKTYYCCSACAPQKHTKVSGKAAARTALVAAKPGCAMCAHGAKAE